jgi:transmembrane sensor
MARTADSATSISEQASHWWTVLHSENASSVDRREFGEWVTRSPERVEAYLQMARLSRALQSRDVRWPGTPADVLIREAKAAPPDVLPFSRGHSDSPVGLFLTGEEGGRAPAEKSRRKAPLLAGLAASLVAVGLGMWLLLSGAREYQTAFGEQRSVLLDDGSRVTLNTASKIEVDLRKDRRLIHLVRGEALFDVAHDVKRPFDVQAGNTVLRAVGTQFNVELRPNDTTVTVVEGRVAVVPRSEVTDSLLNSLTLPPPLPKDPSTHLPAPTAPLILAAEERLTITRSGPGTPHHVTNMATATSWTQHQLVFESRPLSEVAAEFNRYNRGHIEIDSPDLQRQEVTGVFQSNDPGSFLSFLSQIPGVEIRDAGGGGHIVTTHAQATPGASGTN